MNNYLKIKIPAISENEALARSIIACFCLPLNPSVSELNDIKTAVSEAVTNSVVHGYPDKNGEICLEAEILDDRLHIKISDSGIGIDNLEQAMEPFYTTKSEEERSGMGFTIMQTFMEDVKVTSKLGQGTIVEMSKTVSASE